MEGLARDVLVTTDANIESYSHRGGRDLSVIVDHPRAKRYFVDSSATICRDVVRDIRMARIQTFCSRLCGRDVCVTMR